MLNEIYVINKVKETQLLHAILKANTENMLRSWLLIIVEKNGIAYVMITRIPIVTVNRLSLPNENKWCVVHKEVNSICYFGLLSS